MTDRSELKVKVVTKMIRQNVVGTHKKRVDTVKNWFATDEQGRVETIIREMIRHPGAPLEGTAAVGTTCG